MEARDHELTKELDATLHARRELGTEYESALIESFLEKIEQRMDDTIDRRVRRHLAEQQMAAARGGRPGRSGDGFGSFADRFGFAMFSTVLAIPLSAIGAAHAGLEGLIVAWAGIVGVNAMHAFRDRIRLDGRRKPDTEWDG
ncbi:hypothetical protein [Streptomyces sp. NPDC002133]|uniref:hypothetical protein n=1 Tax=Streptomyces sp. NPDC002133 TaxID=3154409 RepID=UPI0033210796